MDDYVYLHPDTMKIQETKVGRRVGLLPEVTDWLIERLGPMSQRDAAGINNWCWVPCYDVIETKKGWNRIQGARVWIRDKKLRLLFKLTWGGR